LRLKINNFREDNLRFMDSIDLLCSKYDLNYTSLLRVMDAFFKEFSGMGKVSNVNIEKDSLGSGGGENIKIETVNAEEFLRDVNEKRTEIERQKEANVQTNDQKIGLVYYLMLNGLSNPLLDSLEEIKLEEVVLSSQLEDFFPQMEVFKKDLEYFYNMLSRLIGEKVDQRLSSSVFALFKTDGPETSGVQGKYNPASYLNKMSSEKSSFCKFMLSVIVSLQESNFVKKELITELIFKLQDFLSLKPSQGGKADLMTDTNNKVVRYVMLVLTGLTDLPLPMSMVDELLCNVNCSYWNKIVKGTLHQDLIVSDG
jgi:hypothetical protein